MLRIQRIILLCLLLCLVSCGKKYRLHEEDISETSIWPYSRGEASALGSAENARFAGRLGFVWESGMNGKPAGPPALYHNTIVCPENRKRICFWNRETGQNLGRVKIKGIPYSGVVISGQTAFVAAGPKRNELLAYDLVGRNTLWELPLRDANAGPILINSRLLVSTRGGTLMAVSPDDGSRDWTFRTDDRFTASASVGDGRIFQPADNGRLYAVSVDDGRELYRIDLEGPIVGVPAVTNRVYTADVTGSVYALEPATGEIVWEQHVGHPVWTSPAVAHGRLFVGHSDGGVVALDALTGEQLWTFDAVEVVRASPLAVGQYVVVATMGGHVYVIGADSGEVVDSTEVKGGVLYPPITDGTRVYVTTQAGKIVCFGENDEQVSTADQGINAQHEP